MLTSRAMMVMRLHLVTQRDESEHRAETQQPESDHSQQQHAEPPVDRGVAPIDHGFSIEIAA